MHPGFSQSETLLATTNSIRVGLITVRVIGLVSGVIVGSVDLRENTLTGGWSNTDNALIAMARASVRSR
jgi:hypothetical protein